MCSHTARYFIAHQQKHLVQQLIRLLRWWRKKSQKNGLKPRQILTVGNVIVNLKLPYIVERRENKKYKRKPKGQGFLAFLRWLGMECGVTPYLWSTIAKYGTITTTNVEIAATTQGEQVFTGINLTANTPLDVTGTTVTTIASYQILSGSKDLTTSFEVDVDDATPKITITSLSAYNGLKVKLTGAAA